MAQRLIALTLAATLAACATRPVEVVTVDIFSNQPEHPEVIALGEKLEAAGYRHRVIYAEPPGELEVAETVIVHGDSTSAFSRAQELQGLLSAPGDSIRIEGESYGNHHFNSDNLGIQVYLPEPEPKPELKVRAHFAGSCSGHPLELFLRIDRSYRLKRQGWGDDQRLVGAGDGNGDWAPSGAGYEMTTSGGVEWALEPPLDTDPAVNVYFVRGHPEIDGCRLKEAL